MCGNGEEREGYYLSIKETYVTHSKHGDKPSGVNKVMQCPVHVIRQSNQALIKAICEGMLIEHNLGSHFT